MTLARCSKHSSHYLDHQSITLIESAPRTSPCNARIDLNRYFPQVVGDGMNTFWSAARRNLGIRSWELHHEHRRDALFYRNCVRRLKSLILNGKWRVLCEVDWGRRIFEKYFGHFWGLILDLEAETLSESRSFDAAPAHMGLEGWFY